MNRQIGYVYAAHVLCLVPYVSSPFVILYQLYQAEYEGLAQGTIRLRTQECLLNDTPKSNCFLYHASLGILFVSPVTLIMRRIYLYVALFVSFILCLLRVTTRHRRARSLSVVIWLFP